MSDINKIIQNSREDKSRLASDLGINLSSAQGNVNRTQTYTLHGNGNNQSSWNNSPNRYLNEGVDGLKSVNSLHSDGKDE